MERGRDVRARGVDDKKREKKRAQEWEGEVEAETISVRKTGLARERWLEACALYTERAGTQRGVASAWRGRATGQSGSRGWVAGRWVIRGGG